jgi:hypothetical protein
MTGDLHEAALGYAAGQGLHVFPLHYPVNRGGSLMCSCGNPQCSNAGKHPYPRHAPRGLLNATVDKVLIDRWWSAGTPYNIGIRTGKPSGIVAVDIDPRHGGDVTLADLERRNGPLPATWRFFTGSGGQHLLFRHPGGTVPNSAGKVGPGVDARADGGFIVAPPSLHICGRRYTISLAHHPDDVPLADMPDWLAALVRPPAARPCHSVMPRAWRRLVAEGADHGRRNDAVARLSGLLLRRGLDPFVALDLVRCWNQTRCRPPLDEDELVRIVDSICARELNRRAAANG